ncbi:TetR/AcrR family transcriptional regulator [Rhizobium ruizarguesonis]|uniref:TetR/AcrR family transcriptional regulator n=1 Tax=Rhizobium ruizarguesonis TaxID=2081791 RepID=UPI00102F8258|nr:TetR/AcrR family transcriptional regulator [Rhizobium ruizarguesonis]TAV98407.1 TetR/AcrR family transcriptional regulator [Rhizobium ruizarguesonis]TAW15900.1 TetR/AcrR family transcriptional regulator [Rhizobium ruizarguesonis]TAZ51433.1 TetR/AcrR family transcriptional regulator [Rhizobium ruizarguesonis]TBC98742.1 TetR/AcrR family transcriptional regulator [Rhizobium ruizarguesonis]TBD15579.1 TetR/AcrR family transcriptional regulator [Rhizobium ruizarguesonis]
MISKSKPSVRTRTSIGSRRSPEAEAAVLAAARDLISERGYTGFSVEEVARRAGSGKTTIYRWYPTKADLFIAIYTAERLTSVPVPDTGDLVDDLEQYTTSLWRFWASHPAGAALKSLIAEAQGTAEALDALRDRFLPDRTADVRRMFANAADRGEIPSEDVDDKVSLWVGLSWFKLLVNELHHESLIRRLMGQIAGVRSSGRAGGRAHADAG